MKAIVNTALLIFTVLSLTFFAFAFLPNTAAISALGINATPEAIAIFERNLGLDKPLLVQYFSFITNAISLDFGTSYKTGEQVSTTVLKAYGITLSNVLLALSLSVFNTLLLAWMFVILPSIRKPMSMVFDFLTSIPAIVIALIIGILLKGVVIDIGIVYVSMIIALAIVPTCVLSLNTLNALPQIERSYVTQNLVMQGVSHKKQFMWVIVPLTLQTWTPIFSNIAASLLVSATVYELIFSLPGLGLEFYQALIYKDLPIMQCFVFSLVLTFLFIDKVIPKLFGWMSKWQR